MAIDPRVKMVMYKTLAELIKHPDEKMVELTAKMLQDFRKNLAALDLPMNNVLLVGTIIYFSTAIISFILKDFPKEERATFEEAFAQLFIKGIEIAPVEEEQTTGATLWEELIKDEEDV